MATSKPSKLKPGSRRDSAKKSGPQPLADKLRAQASREGLWLSVAIAAAFFVGSALVLMLRPQVVAYRPGQYAPADVVSRVDFFYHDARELADARRRARDGEPRVYKAALPAAAAAAAPPDRPLDADLSATAPIYNRLAADLLALPDAVSGQRLEQLGPPLRTLLDNATLARLQSYAEQFPRTGWDKAVYAYVDAVRKLNPVIIPADARAADLGRTIRLPGRGPGRGGRLGLHPQNGRRAGGEAEPAGGRPVRGRDLPEDRRVHDRQTRRDLRPGRPENRRRPQRRRGARAELGRRHRG